MTSTLKSRKSKLTLISFFSYGCISRVPYWPHQRLFVPSSSISLKPPFRVLKSCRFLQTASVQTSTKSEGSTPLGTLSKTILPSKPKAGYFPRTSRSIVAYWLLGSAASVFGLVVFGGLTRLTESG